MVVFNQLQFSFLARNQITLFILQSELKVFVLKPVQLDPAPDNTSLFSKILEIFVFQRFFFCLLEVLKEFVIEEPGFDLVVF